MIRLSQYDPFVKTFAAKTGEHIIAGGGELHPEICLRDLKEQYMKGTALRVCEPDVSYRERNLTVFCTIYSNVIYNRILQVINGCIKYFS